MKLTKIARLGIATLVSVSSLLTLSIPMAAAATKTWTGGGSDGKFSTGANWSGGTAPTAGSDLVFPYGASVTNKTMVNDLTAGTSFVSITFNGTIGQTESTYYTLSGNALTLTGGIVDTDTGGDTISTDIAFSGAQTLNVGTGSYLDLSGVLSGSGALTKTGTGYLLLSGNNTFTGSLTANAGEVSASSDTALGTTAGATIINDTASLYIGNCQGALTVAENFTFTGSDANADSPKLQTASFCRGGGGGGGGPVVTYGLFDVGSYDTTLTGTVTLGSDVNFGSYSPHTTISGAMSGNFKFNLPEDKWGGTLVINSSNNTSGMANGSYTATASSPTLSDSVPGTSIIINHPAVVTIDGTRGDTVVNAGGTLKGHGTVGALSVATDGIVAPGNSPGCLNTADLAIAGTLQEEIGGSDPCTGYDQVKVTGAVSVTDGTLTPSLYNGFVPEVGQSYTIIDNDGSDAVTGTFTGLAEGATFTANGVTYSITYVGGDGNDVVLTVTNVDASQLPKTPDTGMRLVAAHPLLALGATTVAAFGLLIAARRLKPARR
ncbi:MAG: hypothetical protein JWN38_878 [Candidatus Saccharibacteria bacterium]|nr:hypothetical protein [Candidatus Saccharibacteria bacterium]